MRKMRGLGLHLVFVSIFVVAITYTCLGSRNISAVCSEQERLALLNFKSSVEDDLELLSSWVGNECCSWERIQCDASTGNVESLLLRGDHDNGHYLFGNGVNSSLAELRHLKYLDLSGNWFGENRIPEFIGSLKELRYLNLSHAGFHGIVPSHIGNLSNLKVLDLSSNWMMIDDVAWSFGLLSLEHLDLSRLNLSGTQNWEMVLYMIPMLKELSLSFCHLTDSSLGPLNSSRPLPKIKHLDLGFNSFKCPLPYFLQNMTSLTFLDLSGFNISFAWNFANLLNMIPSLYELHLSSCGIDKMFVSSRHLNFSALSNIHHLDLSQKSIEGMFPSFLTNMSSLAVLDLSRNMLNSSVPIMPSLVELDISFNEFNQSLYITIPEPLVRLVNLRGMDLSSSGLTGPIPKSLGRLRFLEVLDLSHNQITGPIPTFLGKLSTLDLSYNQLNGSIPESFGKLATLTDLYLAFNRLTGPIPESLGRLGSLQAISMRSNLLDGTIPISIGQLAKLQYLDISNNSFEGVVFEVHFANLSMLKDLDTSFNSKLTFNVSREWVPTFQLVNLQLSSCNVKIGFPQWLQNQRKLDNLLLSNASISGPLPTWFQNMNTISILDLSHNKLIGPLTNIPNGQISRYLFLEDNLFNESIPRSLCRLTHLIILDLSKNRLTGKLPQCLENLRSFTALRFSSNQLSGVVPSSIAVTSLTRLILSNNNFIGELPLELGNLRYLNVLDLGDNKFSRNIPNWIGENLTSLNVLRLHKNNFTGRIPRSLCKASYLQILDVGYNNLTGTIPPCLGELNAMKIETNPSPWGWGPVNMNYVENVIRALKGVDLEYTTVYLVYNMDFSSNKLAGKILVELTALSMLVGLNLSTNHLSGGIPDTIGNMTRLFSLDLSRNELIGMIPPSMASLNFLSHLNLSHNNLSGRIPTESQLQTLIDPSIYTGNEDLCGPPLTKNCPNHDGQTTMPKKKYKEADESTKVWLFYVDIVCCFVTGFWGIIGVLLYKKQWRQKIFMCVEEIIDKIYVAVMIRVAKMKRGREAA